MATTNDLKNGLVLNIDGQLWTVVEFQHVKPGKGGAFVRTTLKNVMSGKVVDRTFNAGTKVETANVDKRAMTYLYKEGTDYVFMDADTFDPPLPANVSFHMFVFDAALCLEIRILESKADEEAASASFTGFNFRDRLSSALGGTRPPAHDEADKVYKYKGVHVRVKEKIRVETQDPTLISASAKLNALEHSLMLSRKALDMVMGRDEPEN